MDLDNSDDDFEATPPPPRPQPQRRPAKRRASHGLSANNGGNDGHSQPRASHADGGAAKVRRMPVSAAGGGEPGEVIELLSSSEEEDGDRVCDAPVAADGERAPGAEAAASINTTTDVADGADDAVEVPCSQRGNLASAVPPGVCITASSPPLAATLGRTTGNATNRHASVHELHRAERLVPMSAPAADRSLFSRFAFDADADDDAGHGVPSAAAAAASCCKDRRRSSGSATGSGGAPKAAGGNKPRSRQAASGTSLDTSIAEHRRLLRNRWGVVVAGVEDEKERRFRLFVAVSLSKQTQFPVVLKAFQLLHAGAGIANGRLTVENLAQSDQETLHQAISFVHYNKQKAKHLIASAALLRGAGFDGLVPSGARSLQQFPGIGPTMADLLTVLLNRDV